MWGLSTLLATSAIAVFLIFITRPKQITPQDEIAIVENLDVLENIEIVENLSFFEHYEEVVNEGG